MSSILVVEDEVDLQDVLSYNLKQAGHDVAVTDRGGEGINLARQRRPDLVLLDLMLPDMSGIEVCRTLKADAELKDIPIVIITAKGEEIDRVVGFELGADDYVVKPFSVRELLLRVAAVLRRSSASPSEHPPAEVSEFGLLKIDRGAHRVWIAEAEVPLTPLEFRLLTTLFDRKNRVQTRASLLDDVWDVQSDLTTRTVDTHIKRLREKLADARDYIETVRGVGYRFVAEPTYARKEG